MTQISSNENKICAKIICTYFGSRRSVHNTPQNMIEFLKLMIENEINIDNGVPTDVIIINNNCNNIESNDILNSYHNVETKNGKIIVETRDNKGGSFGGYYDMFLKYKDDYSYWFFCEDDVLVYKNGYIKDFIEFLDSDDNLGFISLAPISISHHPKHSGGGCGLTSTNKFLRSRSIADIEHFLKTTSRLNERYETLEGYEIMFTNNFITSKMDIKNHPQYSPYCLNFESHAGQKSNYVKNNKEQEIIYKVGF
jgi:hypothetical protein